MKRITVRNKVKADRVAENQTLIRAVLKQLAYKTPVGLRCAVFKLPDVQSFAHGVSVETAAGTNPLNQLAATRRAVCGRLGPGAGP